MDTQAQKFCLEMEDKLAGKSIDEIDFEEPWHFAENHPDCITSEEQGNGNVFASFLDGSSALWNDDKRQWREVGN